MASIAYITDQDMIEYHRLNGHDSINFYRPNNKKNIVNFAEGDLLFFMSKKTEKGRKREKGLVGYGVLNSSASHSLKKMWEAYGVLNGHSSFEQLRIGILKIFKLEKMPRSFNCFFLTNVNYFKTPIYLSEFGYNISNKIESFFYLDKEEDLTNRILEKASHIGLDLWSSTMNESIGVDDLNQTIISHTLSTIGSLINYSPYDNTHTSRLNKLKNKMSHYYPIKDNEFLYYRLENNKIKIFALSAHTNKTFNQIIVTLIGIKELLTNYLLKEDYVVEYSIVFLDTLNASQAKYLDQLSIDYTIV